LEKIVGVVMMFNDDFFLGDFYDTLINFSVTVLLFHKIYKLKIFFMK